MRWACPACKAEMFLVAFASLALSSGVWGQAAIESKSKGISPASEARGSAKTDLRVQAIDDNFQRMLRQLEQTRLDQLGVLASQQPPTAAAATYERFFRLAIEGDLFKYVESTASKVVEQGTPSSATNALAHLVKLIAEVDGGKFEQSLRTMGQALADSTAEKRGTATRAVIAPSEIIEIFELYYQRLVDASQYSIAREAIRLALEKPYRSAFKDFLSSRLKRIELVGKPAPPIQSKDLDGKEFDLAGH